MEYVACNLCGSRNSEVLYPSTLPEGLTAGDIERFRCTSSSYGKHHTIVKCRNCGLVYANPHRKANAILHNYEEVVDKLYVEEGEERVLTFRRNLRPLEELMPPDQGWRLLDVGCHIGVFLEIAQERGWEAWGVEPSRWAARKARSKGLRVIEGTLEAWPKTPPGRLPVGGESAREPVLCPTVGRPSTCNCAYGLLWAIIP